MKTLLKLTGITAVLLITLVPLWLVAGCGESGGGGGTKLDFSSGKPKLLFFTSPG